MGKQIRFALCAVVWALFGCGSGNDVEAPSPEAAGPAEAVSLAGMYQVSGFTVVIGSEDRRDISGTIIMAQEGDSYTATFNLVTEFPTVDGSVKSDIIGQGEGVIEGRVLRGSARTQIVAAGVPGVDPGFAFIPRRVGTRIVSRTFAEIAEDGTLRIELENEPAEGAEYISTRTVLTGTRMQMELAGDSLPDVAAPAD